MKRTIIQGLILAGLGSSTIAATAPADGNKTETKLTISTQGSVKKNPDLVVISAGVVTQAKDAHDALQDNANRMARVIAALRSAGIADKDIATESISLQPNYNYQANQAPKITGYQATNTLTVRFHDIGKSGAVLDTLAAQGANQINGPQMMLDHPEEAMDEARVDAMKKAQARATLYANAAGLHIKRIVSINEEGANNFAPRPMMMARMASAQAADSATEIMPGQQSVSITVNVEFELQ